MQLEVGKINQGKKMTAIGAISGPSKALPRAQKIPEASEGGELRVAKLVRYVVIYVYFILTFLFLVS
jgi:hypothetical protein